MKVMSKSTVRRAQAEVDDRSGWLRYFVIIPSADTASPSRRVKRERSIPRANVALGRFPRVGQIFSLEPAVSRVLFRRCRR